MRVLALNWRDPRHPEAGGAEVHLSEILKRWVERGASITWVASGFAGGAPEETLDGMRVLRRGDWWNANWAARAAVRGELAGERFDLVIEDLNKLPYFSPWWAPAPVLVVVPHLFGTTVFAEASPPMALAVWAHEAALPVVYRRTPFLVISESTKSDLVARGVAPERVAVSYCGMDHSRYSPGGSKRPVPTVIYLGRLRRYKGVDRLLEAFADVLADFADARLEIVGDGPYRAALERHAARLGLGERVEFTGFVPSEDKLRRLRAAWVSALPSPKEGWGLTVVESNASGTPVVASRSPGLVDSVRDGETGLLVPHGDRAALAAALRRLLGDAELRRRLTEGGLEWARRFSWQRASDEAWAVARAVLDGRPLPQRFPDTAPPDSGEGGGIRQRSA